MKTIILLFVVLFFNTGIIAQADAAYKGAGKVDMLSFWRQAEIFEKGRGSATTLGNMKRALDNLKQKDPTYSVAAMEETYKKWKAEIDKVADAGKTSQQKEVEAKINEIGYTGPASRQVKYFWEYAAKTKDASESELNHSIREMEYALKATKEKDPAYNAAEMEATLKKLKDEIKEKKLAEVRQTHGDKRSSRPVEKETNDPKSLFEKIFLSTNISVGSTSDLPEAPAKIAAYKAKLDKLLTMDYTDALIKNGKQAKASISGSKAATDREINKIDGYIKEVREKHGMEYMYYTIQFHTVFWDAAQKVFPEDASYADMYKKTTTAFSKLGSLEQLYAKAESNRIEYIKNTKLPVAAVKDAKLEKVLTDGFNKLYGTKNNVTALKAVLTQNGWSTLYHSLTGVVVGRERSAKLAYKGSDGKCYVLPDYVFIREEYNGSSYTNTMAIFNGLDGIEMLCQHVN